MMKKNIKKSIYAVCASLGFISALFTHTAASGADVILYHAADLLLPTDDVFRHTCRRPCHRVHVHTVGAGAENAAKPRRSEIQLAI
jgi:hypothetical protein